MYILPNATAFNNACASADRQIATKCEIYVGGSLYATMVGDGINGEIISMEWDNIVCSNDGLQIGTCCMDEFKMTYRKVSTSVSLMGKEIHPYVGVDISGTVTYVPLGVFYVTDVSSEDEDRTFNVTAYDGMQFLMGDFDATALGVTFPINAWALLSAIATHFNLTLTYSEELYRLLSSDNYILTTSDNKTLLVHKDIDANKNVSVEQPLEGTYRDYIGWIAGLVGANAHMGRDGSLVISRYTDYGFAISRDVQHMGGSKINYGGSVTYTSMISGTDENPIYPTGYSGNAITYTNPFIDVAELDLICNEIIGQNGITVTPCDVTWRSNPCVDAGDIVGIEDKDGNMSPTYVMERVMTVTGGLVETLHCYGETEIQKALNKSPLVTKLTAVSKTASEASDYINNTEGTFEFIDNGDGTNGGFTIYENGTSSWLRCTAGGIGISPDGGLTYTNAITKNGVVASRLNVQNNGIDVMRVQYYPDASQGTIVLNNPITGAKGYDVNVTNYGSGYHLYRVDTGEETIGMSTVGNSTSANTMIHMDDPDSGATRIMLNTFRSYNDNSSKNYISISSPTVADSADAIEMMSSLSSGGQLTNYISLYNSDGDRAFQVIVVDNNTPELYIDGHYASWQTKTISGTTIHYLGY